MLVSHFIFRIRYVVRAFGRSDDPLKRKTFLRPYKNKKVNKSLEHLKIFVLCPEGTIWSFSAPRILVVYFENIESLNLELFLNLWKQSLPLRSISSISKSTPVDDTLGADDSTFTKDKIDLEEKF